MQRHPPLIVKDLEEDNQFWSTISNYVTRCISTKEEIMDRIFEINNNEITDISPIEFNALKKKILDIYPNEKIDDLSLSYNIFLGLAHYQNIIKKNIKPTILNFDI
jgi:hypothetical protein